MKKLVAALFLLAGLSSAARAEDLWVFLPGQTFGTLSRGLSIITTETLRWTDGRKVLVTYMKTSSHVYRCVSLEGEPVHQSSLGCFRLVK